MWTCKYCGKAFEAPLVEQAKHLESEHHLPAVRDGETAEQAVKRFRTDFPEAGSESCKCPACTAGREIGRAKGRDHTSPEQREEGKPF